MDSIDLNDVGNVIHRANDRVDLNDFCGGLNILYVNARSIRNKLDRISLLVNSFSQQVVHVVIVTETWIKPGEEGLFDMSDYKSFHSIRRGSHGGGVTIYVHDGLRASICFETFEMESNYLAVRLLDYNRHVVGFYRPGSSAFSGFKSRICFLMQRFPNSMFVGDANVDLLTASNEIDEYLTMICANGFYVMNKVHTDNFTRRQSMRRFVRDEITDTFEWRDCVASSIIDHVMTDDTIVEKTLTWCSSGDFDHCYAIINLNIRLSETRQQQTKEIIDHNRALHFLTRHVDEIRTIEDFSRVLVNAMEAGRRTVVLRPRGTGQPWMTEEILGLMRTRDRLCILKARAPTDVVLRRQFKVCRNRVNTAVRSAKKAYVSGMFDRAGGDARKYWAVLNEVVLGRLPKRRPVITLNVNGVMTSDGVAVANAFNQFFAQSGQPHLSIDRQAAIALTSPRAPQTQFQFKEINRELVENLLVSMNSGAAAGLDGVTVRFLKKLPPNAVDKLTEVLQDMFLRSEFPSCLKSARTVAIEKKGDLSDPGNYRGVAVLPALSRFPESIMNRSLDDYIDEHRILHQNQFGFTRKSNTLSAVTTLTTHMRQKMDEGRKVGVIFLDLRKAFDCVDHDLLLMRLESIGVSGNELRMMRSYLTGRTSIVEIDGDRGDPINMNFGVPQGSILGPTFFNIFVDPLLDLPTGGHAQLFADDKALVFDADDIDQLFVIMQRALNLIVYHLEMNGLHLNRKKSEYMVMRHPRSELSLRSDHVLEMGGEVISRVSVARYLGCLVDDTLSFTDHVNMIIAKIRSNVFALRRSRHLLSQKAAWDMYYAHINSHVIHLSPIWTAASKQKLRSVEVLQSRALRIVLNKPYDCSRSVLYSERNLPLRLAAQYETTFLVHKIVHGKIHHCFELLQVGQMHAHNTRNANDFRIYRCRTGIGANSILSKGLGMFNDLPNNLKDNMPVSRFKKALKEHIWSTARWRYFDEPDY